MKTKSEKQLKLEQERLQEYHKWYVQEIEAKSFDQSFIQYKEKVLKLDKNFGKQVNIIERVAGVEVKEEMTAEEKADIRFYNDYIQSGGIRAFENWKRMVEDEE